MRPVSRGGMDVTGVVGRGGVRPKRLVSRPGAFWGSGTAPGTTLPPSDVPPVKLVSLGGGSGETYVGEPGAEVPGGYGVPDTPVGG